MPGTPSIVERNILTVLEPAIKLDPLEILDRESGSGNSDGLTMKEKPSEFSQLVPEIKINGFDVPSDVLNLFSLKNNTFYPTCRIQFADTDALFTARFYPKDGDLIQLNIRSQGDETTFKPVRIDFTIVDCKPVGGGGGESANEYLITGRMFVPKLFAESVEYEEEVTSWDALLNIAEKMELGFASNVEETNDLMTWTNPNDTTETWIQDIVANSYLNDDTFFTSYIDPYYYLTLVDVNRLFSQEGAVEASLGFSQNAGDTMGANGAIGQEGNTPNYLSNMVQLQGGARYISKYQMVNKSGEISKANGYKRYTQYWDLETREWVSEFVDPLTNNTPGMIPATKGRLIDGQVEGPRNEQVKYKYLGTQGDNVHAQYQYSTVLNYQNITEINKMGMVIELDTLNPALVRYSRIYCQILEFAPTIKDVLAAPSVADISGAEGKPQTRPDNTDDTNSENGIVNEYLSGFYVITGVEWLYTNPGPIRMRLRLQRREFTPTT
tara:strand:+ start:5073 stop:6560 length:1488 start_codon:yes stop_codon:yes gene_type:complete